MTTVWTRLREELDRAGRVAQTAFDEGRARLELMRTQQLADKAAQAIGYAVFKARQEGKDIEKALYDRLSASLTEHQAEVTRQEDVIKNMKTARDAEWRAREKEAAEAPPPAA